MEVKVPRPIQGTAFDLVADIPLKKDISFAPWIFGEFK